jgi:hypothetical protein
MHKILGIWSEIQVYHWCKESCELWQKRHGYEGHIRHKPKLESKKNLKMFGAVSMNDWSKTGFSLVTPWTSTEARATCVLAILSSTKHWNKAEFFPLSNKMILSSQDCKQRDGLKDSRTSKHTLVRFLVINLSNNSCSCGGLCTLFSPLVTFPLHLLHSYHTSRLLWTGKLFLSLITLLHNSQHADDLYTLILSQFSLAEDPFRWYLAAGLIWMVMTKK